MNLYEAIYARKSVRHYIMEAIDDTLLSDIGHYYRTIVGMIPGIETELGIIDNSFGQRRIIGLFGHKAPYYLALYSEKKEHDRMNAGFIMEQMGLYLVTRGLGYCILGSARIKDCPNQRDGKSLVMIMAFGKAADEHVRKPVDIKRLPMDKLCYYKEQPRQWINQLLEAARVAPSSMNSQPWRFVVYDNRFHVFSRNTKVQKMNKWEEINFGIMLSHIAVVSEELWLDMDMIRLENISQKNFSNSQYVISIILKT